MTEIVIAEGTRSPDDSPVEIVERKGLGHPDSICDAVAERVSQTLSRVYLERTGAIQHHNADKALLVAGRAEPRFGGGRILEPMQLYLGDRATEVEGVDVGELAVAAARSWFRENLRYVDPERHLDVRSVLRPGSAELTHVFADPSRARANDTSVGVGFAPLTETEQLVLDAERLLNDPDPRRRRAWVGEDVKVHGVRRGRKLELTVAAPLVDRHVGSEAHYFELKAALHAELVEEIQRRLRSLDEVTIVLDALDQPGQGLDGVYVTVTGTSAEGADSGEVGRGNRVNGLITFHRPMTLEAAAGKNPVSHVGKIYGVFAHRLAGAIHSSIPGVRAAVVWLWSRIGERVSEPAGVSIELTPEKGATFADLVGRARENVGAQLGCLPKFCHDLARGRYGVH